MFKIKFKEVLILNEEMKETWKDLEPFGDVYAAINALIFNSYRNSKSYRFDEKDFLIYANNMKKDILTYTDQTIETYKNMYNISYS